MSYFIETTHNSNRILCQTCLKEVDSTKAAALTCCFSIICQKCQRQHQCNSKIESQISKFYLNSCKIDPKLLQNLEKPFLTAFSSKKCSNTSTSNQLNKSCDRCCLRISQYRCQTCNLMNFCLECIELFHKSSKKLSTHKITNLNEGETVEQKVNFKEKKTLNQKYFDFSVKAEKPQIIKKPASILKINYLSPRNHNGSKANINRAFEKDKSFFDSIDINTSFTINESTINSSKLDNPQGELQKLKHLNQFYLKESKFQKQSMQKLSESLKLSIKQKFSSILSIIKLKQIQLLSKIDERFTVMIGNIEDKAQIFKKYTAEINNMQIAFQNEEQHLIYPFIQKKMKKIQAKFNQLEKQKSEMSSLYKINPLIFDEVKKAEQILEKLDGKKLIVKDSSQNGTIKDGWSENSQKYNGNNNKNMKSSMTLNTCKSMNRLSQFNTSMLSPTAKSIQNISLKNIEQNFTKLKENTDLTKKRKESDDIRNFKTPKSKTNLKKSGFIKQFLFTEERPTSKTPSIQNEEETPTLKKNSLIKSSNIESLKLKDLKQPTKSFKNWKGN